MPNVYVINRSAHDYSGAERYGDIRFLSTGPVNRYATNKMYRLFKEVLDESQSCDYILLTGLTVMASIATAIFAQKHGRLNLLIFRPDSHTYVERRMVLDDCETSNSTNSEL